MIEDVRSEKALSEGPITGVSSIRCSHTHTAEPLAHTAYVRNSPLPGRCLQHPVLRKLNIKLILKEEILKESVICHRAYIEGNIQS